MKYKEFSKSRVCVIDYLPLFEEALKEVYVICNRYNIPLFRKGKATPDAVKFFYHYCLDKFCTGFKKVKSQYPKVLVFYTLPRTVNFTDKNLKKVLSALPLTWVWVSDFNSPDVEMAALQAYNKDKTHKNKLSTFAVKHSLKDIVKKAKNNKTFSVGTVDLSD